VIWGFVDYENTGSLAGFKATDYERLFVFCGPKNSSIKLGELRTTEFTRVDLISVTTTGANNLDFHLAFYLGRLHESTKDGIEFHIISNDTGFNGLLNHLKKIGRKCKRIPTRAQGKPNSATKKQTKTKPPSTLSECIELASTRLKKLANQKRPSTKDTLVNWINSQCRHKKPAVPASKIFEELKSKGKVKEATNGLTYHL